jgi:pimeloyl-ACP methyl ester carboxylesterase
LVRGSGHAPAIVSKLPLPYLKLVLRVAIKRERWQRMEPLLVTNLVEHQELARLDGTAASYGQIAAEVLLLGGTKSPSSVRLSLDALSAAIPRARQQLIEGLAHNAPDETSPAAVAEVVARFLASEPER